MAEQKFYDQVAEEIERKQLDNGLWVRAFSLSLGDDAKARAIYIGLRVERLQVEQDAKAASARAASAARAQQRQAEEAARVLREQERVSAEKLRKRLEEVAKKHQREKVAQAKHAEEARILAKRKMREGDWQRGFWSGVFKIIGNSWPLCLLLALIVAILLLILASVVGASLK